MLTLVTAPALAADDGMLPGQDAITDTQTAVVDTAAVGSLDGILDRLAQARVVIVGEAHDRYEDHLNQLAIIRGLHDRGKDLAIGMEFFQQPFQPQLDAFVGGELDEAGLLRGTEYFERWRYDYRLYRPILRFAREHSIPIVALNIEREITDKVGDAGIGSLSPDEQARIPADMDRDDVAYRDYVKRVFDMHPKTGDSDFQRFLDVQLLWDEGMAERAAAYLQDHPDKTLVVLAGAGHVEYRRGIPSRLERRLGQPGVTVVSGRMRPFDTELADFILYPKPVELPETGMLGVMLDPKSKGKGLGVQGFADGSGAKSAGIEKGDRIVRIDGEPIESYADIRIALMDSRPGETLPVEIERSSVLGGHKLLLFDVELH